MASPSLKRNGMDARIKSGHDGIGTPRKSIDKQDKLG
jgi:hypothetical protein